VNLQRIVIKLGTGTITDSQRNPDKPQILNLIQQINTLHREGKQIILVSSGAVATGRGVLGFAQKPKELALLQACAAVGQCRLSSLYDRLFDLFGIKTAQVLLDHSDLENRDRYLNARNTLDTLLQHRVIPIINENDTVSVEELKFGDNDRLSALVASLLQADLLIILSTIEGLLQDFGTHQQRLIPVVTSLTQQIQDLAKETDNDSAVGGMKTKLMAAQIATQSGIPMIIAHGRKPSILNNILQGQPQGTLFKPCKEHLTGRKRWIAFFHHTRGTISVDDGAKEALLKQGKSLLLPGVKGVEGNFEAGDVIRICDLNQNEIARGICSASSLQLSQQICPRPEVVHRDNMVILS